MGHTSDDLCMCGHLFGHHEFEGHGDQGFTGRCAVGLPDVLTRRGKPILGRDGEPVPNPDRCACARFTPGRAQIVPA